MKNCGGGYGGDGDVGERCALPLLPRREERAGERKAFTTCLVPPAGSIGAE